MEKFIGINMVMACLPLPTVRMYWQKKYKMSLIHKSMSRNRYMIIRRYLKVVEDSQVEEEKKPMMWPGR